MQGVCKSNCPKHKSSTTRGLRAEVQRGELGGHPGGGEAQFTSTVQASLGILKQIRVLNKVLEENYSECAVSSPVLI